ncbi:MAG: helicase [Clostridiaceae bacterium]|nr:helicase [Clostridiaceae bacterium]
MLIEECKKLRKDLLKALETEIVGPGSQGVYDNEEIIEEGPLERYSSGILYPQKEKVRNNEEHDDTAQNYLSEEAKEDEVLDASINISNQYYPSALGISFYTNDICPDLQVEINAGVYRRLNATECESGVEHIPDSVREMILFKKKLSYEERILRLNEKINIEEREALIALFDHDGYRKAIYKIFQLQNNGWKRMPITKTLSITGGDREKITEWEDFVEEGLKLHCIRRPDVKNNTTLFTITLINIKESKKEKSNEDAFFQVGFSVKPADHNIQFLDYNMYNVISDDPEEKVSALLFRNKKTYAAGHGCAVSWESEASDNIKKLKTESIPFSEVPQMKFDIEEIEDEVKSVLSMKHLSDLGEWSKQKTIDMLDKFCQRYEQWITKKRSKVEDLDSFFHDVAIKNLDNCKYALYRMKDGVNLLKQDDDTFKSFQLANRAMFMQRIHTILQEKVRYPEDDPILWPDYKNIADEEAMKSASWRPFQLAFLLLNICGIARESSDDRDITDLIWFPTGGGKTEAYLGVSAFTIFYRRLTKQEHAGGTTIIMRYTLRLLTSQQFQRASTLICACEVIRSQYPIELGNEKITIGLWIGSDSTPNNINEASRTLDKLIAGTEDKNPFQVLTCPWCGTKLVKEKEGQQIKGKWGYKKGSRPKRFIIYCTDNNCQFANELPIKIIDEDIYNTPPTLFFGTVDKFALMPWKREISNIFALDEGNQNLSPDLIIQDELHLISGPLGTIVGIYETALDALCSAKGRKPKIIASTATIRRAEEQVRALYNRKVMQFPPPGTEAEDSFFARQAFLEEKPGRMYAGIMATGKTLVTAQIRVMAALLQYMKEMDYSDDVLDKYWTLVGYFNTLKDIGRTSTLVDDDIKDQVRRIAMRRNKETRMFYEAEELTSRKRAEDIPRVLEKLSTSYPNKGLIEILLASNMISVGVDVDRLGLMLVVNQPKTTSEYIQATSRVGRRYPGLILTLYDGARSRDRSHYEKFIAYHEAFYKYVEPTSVTPFSGPARDRCLHAVLVTLIRHMTGLIKDNDAVKFNKDIKNLDLICNYMLDRVKSIMPEELEDMEKDLNQLLEDWERFTSIESKLTYGTGDQHLLYPAGKKYGKHWSTLQSMRNVDVECNVKVLE